MLEMSGTKSIQIYNIESIAKKMVSEYHDITDMIEHMGTRGASREEILKKYLSELIPQNIRLALELSQILKERRVNSRIYLYMMRLILQSF